MTAAEHGYREPPPPYPSWLAICSNVFNDYITRWHTANATCGGGLKWQVFPSNNGYTYKNAISNGGFFQLAARLARYTNNQTYYSWAERIWNWSSAIGLITPDYRIFDGADETLNCSSIDHTEWSYNVAIYLYGAAALHNYTGGGNIWTTRTNGLLSATTTFLSPFSNASDIMYERQCELTYSCNTDQLSFKAYLSRWLAGTSLMAPHTSARIAPILRASALGAAAACTGAGHNVTCGSRWYLGGSDGTSGVGQSLSVVEVLYALLVNETAPPGRQGDFDTESSSGGMLCACAEMRDGSVAVMPELLGNAMCEDWGNYTFHRG
jgi:mannan endo-1,6-alpha-mannosidase